MTNRPSWNPTQAQFATLLATTTITVYAVIASGAAVAARETAGCSRWPVCVPEPGTVLTADVLLVVGHRLVTGIAGCLLVATLVAGWTVELDRRARLALAGGAAIFGVQIGLGAFVATTEIAYLTELHLVIAAAIFICLLVAVSWTFEGQTAAYDRTASASTTDADHEQLGKPVESRRADQTAQSTESERSVQSPQPESRAEDQPGFDSLRARAGAYIELTKPRLMWLLCLLAVAGMALATTTGEWPSGVTVAATLAGGILAIGASGTFNHLFERDRDQRMERTADRPVATDQIPVRNAAIFASTLVVLSMGVLVVFVNVLAAALTFAAIVYYSVVYTVVLKPNTSWNIAIGGGSGALPALIGWAAVTGSIGVGGLLLAALVVVWTPAHFYNLAIAYRDDYARGGYPMFPVVAGIPAARRRVLLTLGATLLVTASLVVLTPLGWLFAVAAIVAGAVFFASAISQCRRRTHDATMQTFFVSIAYLGVVLAAIVAEALLLFP
jgi:protoheme IX farnesyltransferase